MVNIRVIGILIAIGLLISLAVGGVILFNTNVQSFLGITETEELDFCSTETECIDYLESQGMPDNFLQENGIQIECEDGTCQAIK